MGKIRSTANGIEHCGTMQEWKDLDYRIEEGLWVWSCPICQTDLRADTFTTLTFETEVLPILFGRGIWAVQGKTVEIEVPGWYEYRNGNWVYSDDQSDR